MIRSLPLLVLLAGCSDVSQTGPYGLRGRLVDHQGQPIAGQRIVSEEHGTRTGDGGHFQIQWKAPATYATFERFGLRWRRRWREGVDPAEVEIELPKPQSGDVSCQVAQPCRVQVVWDQGEGLEAIREIGCSTSTRRIRLEHLPEGRPEATCESVVGTVTLDVDRLPGSLVLSTPPPPRPVGFAGGREGCAAHVLRGEIRTGRDAIRVAPEGPTWAWSECEGQPGTPVRVTPRPFSDPQDDPTIILPVADTGVYLPMDPPVPAPSTLRLIRRSDAGGVGWEMDIAPEASANGYRLPPLARGSYLLGVGGRSAMARRTPPDPEIPATVVWVHARGTWGQKGGYVGGLRLEEDHVGPLRVDGHPPPGGMSVFGLPEPEADTDAPTDPDTDRPGGGAPG